MPQIDHSKGHTVQAEEVDILLLEADQESLEFVDPSKGAFTGESVRVHLWVEQPLGSGFSPFAIAPILRNVGDHSVIEAGLACVFGIERTICVEISSLNVQSQALDVFESCLKVGFELEGIIMIACHDFSGGEEVALLI